MVCNPAQFRVNTDTDIERHTGPYLMKVRLCSEGEKKIILISWHLYPSINTNVSLDILIDPLTTPVRITSCDISFFYWTMINCATTVSMSIKETWHWTPCNIVGKSLGSVSICLSECAFLLPRVYTANTFSASRAHLTPRSWNSYATYIMNHIQWHTRLI